MASPIPSPEGRAAGAQRPVKRPILDYRDVDHGARGYFIQSLVWSLVGGVITAPVGMVLQWETGTRILAYLGASVFTFLVVTVIRIVAVGAVVGSVAPSGSSTPYKQDHSKAKALAVQGRFAEAVQEFERAAEENPSDAEPCLHLARIYRDELREFDKSVEWFRQALSVATDVKTQNVAIRELADVFMNRMGEPKRALPDLARFAHNHAGTPTGDWASKEILEIKKEVAWEA